MREQERWRCLSVADTSSQEIVVCLPQELISQINIIKKREKINTEQIVHQSLELYVNEHKKRSTIYQVMQQGYLEMAKINLHLCTEAFVAEQEADHTLKRLVNGV